MQKVNPKYALGPASLLILALLVILTVYIQKLPKSTLVIEPFLNSFNLKFYIASQDKGSFDKILQNLIIPQKIYDGVNIELDSTSSAKLAFFTPIDVNLEVSQASLSYKGQLSSTFDAHIDNLLQVKVPSNVNLVIFSKNLTDFFTSRSKMPDLLKNLISDYSNSQSGHYIAAASNPSEMVFIFQNDQDPQTLKPQFTNKDIKLNEEEHNGIKILTIIYNDKNTQQEKTIFIHQINNLVFIATSNDLSRKMIDLYLNNGHSLMFPQKLIKSDVQFFIYFQNQEDHVITQEQMEFILQKETPDAIAKTKIVDVLKKTENLSFILAKDSFSGLINFK